MNRHNRFTPQWVFLLCGTLLVFIALFLALPVAISAEDTEPETVDAQSGAGWIYPEPVLDSGGADSLQLTSSQLDDLAALRRNSVLSAESRVANRENNWVSEGIFRYRNPNYVLKRKVDDRFLSDEADKQYREQFPERYDQRREMYENLSREYDEARHRRPRRRWR